MSGYVVVDASLVVKWYVSEEYSEEALAILDYWNALSVQPAAPSLVRFEVSNVLHKKVLRGEISVSEAVQVFDQFLDSGIEFSEPFVIHGRAIELASELRQGAAYDSHYLALAEVLECEMWTADGRFYRSAGREIGRVRWIGDFAAVE